MSSEPHYASEAAAAPSEVIDSASEGGGPCFSRQHNDPHDLWGLQGHWDAVTVNLRYLVFTSLSCPEGYRNGTPTRTLKLERRAQSEGQGLDFDRPRAGDRSWQWK